MAATPALRRVRLRYVGVERWPLAAIGARGVTLTTFGGSAAPNIADRVMALIDAFARNLPELFARQGRCDWSGWHGARLRTFEPIGQTLAILGLDAFSTEPAWRASEIGMRVVAMQRSPV